MSTLKPEQFARLKVLFGEVSELPRAERDDAIAGLEEDAEVVAVLVLMLGQTGADDERYAQPVQSAILEFSAGRP